MKYLLATLILLLASVSAHSQQSKPDTARMNQIVSSYYEHKQFMGSVLVTRGDQVLFDKSYGYANLEWDTPFTDDAKFRLGSLTKQFTAASIMLLQERGKLKTSDLISLYLHDSPAAWNKITLRNLLTHTSGIPNFTDVPDYGSKIALLPTTPEKEYLSFRDKPLDFQPGEKFSYSNSNYILLGMIVERASGMKYADFLQQNLFGPLHMNNTGMDSNTSILHHRVYGYSAAGGVAVNADYADMTVPFAAGALYSTTHDLATWNSALYGGKVLKPESLMEMTTPYKNNYCYGLFVKIVDGDKYIEHGGGIEGFDTFLSYDTADKLSVVVLSNMEGRGPSDIVDELAAVAHGKKVVVIPDEKAVPVSPKVLEQYVGTYALSPTLSAIITLSDGHLVASATNSPNKVPLAAASESKFFSTALNFQIQFFKNEKGEVDRLIIDQGGHETRGNKK
jgi:CubicO group peptidase (beta-lactamase class C family)